MKKNKMMRLASALMVAVLATTCAVGNTFAKYVTKASATDTARVAKWGVTLGIVGDKNFTNEYITDDSSATNAGIAYSVKSYDGAKVVAPGTQSEEGDGIAPMKFSISGTPEVAVKVDTVLSSVQEIYLKAGEYTDYTQLVKQTDGTYSYSKKFILNQDYYPVVWTLTQTKNASGPMATPTVVKTGKLSDIKDALTEYTNGNDSYYKPNVNLSAEFELSWKWAFEATGTVNGCSLPVGYDNFDVADTLLGNLQAGTATIDDTTKYNLTTSYTLALSATQVD